DFYKVKAEFSTAQAVVPGQGQTVDIAGVQVGDIDKVELKNGVAVVSMNIRNKYKPIYRDAHMLLRPKTGLKDMIVELDPGTKSAGALAEGDTIPVQNTAPDVNLDEVLSSLDSDTRTYLEILVNSGGEAFGKKGYTADLRETFKRFEPTNRDLAKITGLLSKRRDNIKRVIHNFSLLTTELGKRDTQLAQFVGSANANFRALANQSANIQESLRLLPPTLTTARTSLIKADALAKELGPTLQSLRPAARALGPALVQVRPFLRTTTPVIQNQLRPFARDVQPTARQLRILGDNLQPLVPKLTTSFKIVNSLLNTLAYNPPGDEEGFLFWTAWANHDANTIFGTQDAHGPIRRGLIITSCDSLSLLNQVVAANPALNTLFQLLNAPAVSKVCPTPVPGAPKSSSPKKVTGAKPAPDATQGSPTPGKPTTPPKSVTGGNG
ncbi:MAG: phospholipid/cholesterol/gamma-HCH transport system substrate-binding protein, partial [Thermoleophilaceae bacterium]|nr:phospholipid/cholesterol/gamma-HCH transport system substrate-binding protein [Thermoleophilaceae bacterium]